MPENLYCPGAIEIRFLLVFRDPAAVNLKAEAAFRCGHEKHLFFVAPATSLMHGLFFIPLPPWLRGPILRGDRYGPH